MGSSAMELEHETQSLLGQVVDATVISSLRRSAAQSLDMHLWAAASSAKRVTIALAAFAVHLSVENTAGFKHWATLKLMEKGWTGAALLLYATMNALLVMVAVCVTLFVAPAAAGSGIAECKAYLNGIDIPGIFYLNTLVAKLVGTIGAVAGGLAVGKEGPLVHAGACIATLISQDRGEMVVTGAAAGVAAAFRSPVGGVLFALEEMSSWWRNALMWRVFFTTAVVSVTVRMLIKASCSSDGQCGFFGSGGFIIFEVKQGQEEYQVYELVPMLLLGVIGGLSGSAFISLTSRLASWRRRHLTPWGVRGRLAEALLLSLLTSSASFMLPLAFSCQDDAIRNLFSSQTKREYTVTALVTFVSVFFVLAVLTYGVACPTGFFVPSILCGAAYGRLVGIFVADLQPLQHVDEGTYALLGAASFLGGSMRITMCTCVLLLELTNNLALLPLIMLVLLVAKAVGDGTGVAPLYNEQMRLKGLPFLAPSPSPVLRHISAKECCGRPPVAFNQVEQVGHLVAVLKACHHNGFPVMHTATDGNSAILGVLLRQHLLLLLSTGRAFQSTPGAGEASSRVASSYSITDFHKPVSSPGLSIQDITRLIAPALRRMPPSASATHFSAAWASDTYVWCPGEVNDNRAGLPGARDVTPAKGVTARVVRAHAVVGMLCREDLLPDTIERRLEAGGGSYAPDGSLSFGMSPRSYQHSPAALGQSRPGTPGHPARSASPAAMLPSRLRPAAAHGPSHLATDLESSGDAAAQDAGIPQGSSYANGQVVRRYALNIRCKEVRAEQSAQAHAPLSCATGKAAQPCQS
ncbi:hypothetical protein QJQ45_000747 [Haematococcus lacustris]|nr:hypothetical protein QJQ45_000747 [Haematococcus lacustris]